MSGIAGMYRSHCSVQPEILDAMLDAMAHRGPDARGTWYDGPSGLASCLLKTTSESQNELPVTSIQEGRIRLVWDGRIDNRAALLNLLGLPQLQNAPDSELFAHAYQTWNVKCLDRIEGEFAFALWDRKNRLFFAGRDRVGVKPFHYAWDGHNFFFASEAKALFKAAGNPGVDDAMVLSFLSYRNFTEEAHTRTFFKGISRLAPSHYLTLQDGTLKTVRYAAWDLETIHHYKDEREYAEHFRSIFREAVSARLRSNGKVTALLSGGLDSSAIVAEASSILRGSSHPGMEALNYYSDDSQMDERAYAREAAEHAGISLQSLFTRTRDFSQGLGDFLYRAESPMINTSRNLEPLELLQGRGTRVILTGEGGDEAIDEFGFASDLMAHGRFIQALRKAGTFTAELNESPLSFLKESFTDMMPASLRSLRRRMTGNVPPAWLNKSLINALGLRESLLKGSKAPKFRSFCQAANYYAVTKPYPVMKVELEERVYAMHGMEVRYPFRDRRIIQFMLSMPWQVRAGGRRKAILKQAMKDVMPERILNRGDKGDHTRETDEALTQIFDGRKPEEMLNRSGLMARYLDFPGAARLVERYQKGSKNLRFEVWFLIAMDQWLKQFQGEHDERETRKIEEEVPLAASH